MKLPSLIALCALSSFLFQPDLLLAQYTAAPPPTFGAKGFVSIGNLTVASTSVGTAGTGYTSLPSVTFSGGNGAIQATGTAVLKVVGSVTVTAGGSGYSTSNVLTLVGGTGTAATFTVSSVSGGAVTGVTITSAGAYTVPQTATGAATTGGAGSGCTLTVGYGVGSITLTNAGTGYYSSAPSIAFSGGGGSSAAATATLSSQPTVTTAFNGLLFLYDTVIAAYTPYTTGDYKGDSTIVGKTFKAGTWAPLQGRSIQLTSGYAIGGRY